MGLFDLFSGHDQRVASMQAIQAIQAAQAQATAALQQGEHAGQLAVDDGQNSSLTSLTAGYGSARQAYSDASALYDPYVQTGQNAFNLYADATGVNGAAGNAAATEAFQDSPGYAKQVTDATDAVARQQSALGALGSGNTEQAIATKASDLANTEWQQYLGNLNNVAQTGYAATGAQAGLQKGVGDLYASEGNADAGIYTGAANARAGIDTGTASNLANLDTTDGNNIAGYDYKAFTADQDASKNAWGAILGLGKTAATLGGFKLGSL